MRHFRAARARLTYANVTSSLALFIALGGTSYAALTLPRNSVGSNQIRTQAVGASELRTNSVSSHDVRDRGISLRDLSTSTRSALRGQQGVPGPQGPAGQAGPAGPTLRAVINSAGERVAGNAISSTHAGGSNEYRLSFGRDLGGCAGTATLAAVQLGSSVEPAPAGRVTVALEGNEMVVRTFDASGAIAPVGFHALLSC